MKDETRLDHDPLSLIGSHEALTSGVNINKQHQVPRWNTIYLSIFPRPSAGLGDPQSHEIDLARTQLDPRRLRPGGGEGEGRGDGNLPGDSTAWLPNRFWCDFPLGVLGDGKAPFLPSCPSGSTPPPPFDLMSTMVTARSLSLARPHAMAASHVLRSGASLRKVFSMIIFCISCVSVSITTSAGFERGFGDANFVCGFSCD